MEYGKIVAVTGLPGLYELLSSKSDGAIVRSLDDKSTRFVSSRVHSFSHLESIEVYTVRENVNLVDILQAMEKGNEALPDVKDSSALKKYFGLVYPDLDFERVYTSDMKKMVKWYEALKANEIAIKLSEPPAEEEPAAAEEETVAPAVEEKAAKKPVKEEKKEEPAEEKPKKTAAKKKEEPAVEEKAAKEEPPKKKAATKSKAKETKEEKPAKEAAPKKKAAPKKSK